MKSKTSKSFEKARNLALSSLMAGACFAIMYVCSLTGVFDLCAVVICSMIVIVAVIEVGGIYPWLIWLVSGTLCMIFIPDKFAAMEFALFGGVYPMIKAYLERYPAFISWTLKLTFFNIVLTGAFYIAKFFFPGTDVGFTLGAGAYALGNIFFIMADITFSLLISMYFTKIRPRISKQK